MRISQYFRLKRSQPTLDFVDVDIYGDLPVFIDPRALRLLGSQWADECVSLIQNFFQTILNLISERKDTRARQLLRVLREPNEVHLGFSGGVARGRGLGNDSAHDVWEALSQSEAVKSGLLEDLEDTILMVEGIAGDIVSDISINIMREPLIHYTQTMCRQYGILLRPNINSGPLWDPKRLEWYSDFVDLPMTPRGRLLLVPKAIVRCKLDYDVEEYYRHYLLEYLIQVEKQANTELVQLLKNGETRVTKKDLEAKYGRGKNVIVRETLNHPEVLDNYRADKRKTISPPLSHRELALTEETEPPNWAQLYAAVAMLQPGRDSAGDYENAIEQLLTALFYPSLVSPQLQKEIHEGRKRIDITYTNMATEGFFHWTALHFPASHIFVECKNYGGEVGNPELDQLAGRFSPSRGLVGLLVCRNFTNKELFLKRCRDTAQDGRGYIILLDDEDLKRLLPENSNESVAQDFGLLKERFDQLIM